jgi:hypothetical protein
MSDTGPGRCYDYFGYCIAEEEINRNKGGGDLGNGPGCLSVIFVISVIGGITGSVQNSVSKFMAFRFAPT